VVAGKTDKLPWRLAGSVRAASRIVRNVGETSEGSDHQAVRRVVVFLDICSSSKILDNLKVRDRVPSYVNLLIATKSFLLNKAVEWRDNAFDLYKFIGDGWVLVFPEDVTGKDLAGLLVEVCHFFEERLNQLELSTVLEARGLTFGADEGMLTKVTMNGQVEYIGPALNIAARLQSKVKDKVKGLDRNREYKALVSNPLAAKLRIPSTFSQTRRKVELRNIDPNFACVEVTVLRVERSKQ
jgi:class 3 adenylate cyclase